MTTPQPEVLLTKQQFQGWLESKPPEEIVGYANDCCMCPIAKYLTDKGVQKVTVGTTRLDYEEIDEEKNNQLPGWARNFVSTVDKLRLRERDYPVTAAEAITAIASISTED